MARPRDRAVAVSLAVVAAAVVAAAALLVPGPGDGTGGGGPAPELPALAAPEPYGALQRARARDRELLAGFDPGDDGQLVLERFRTFNRLEHGCLGEDREAELHRARNALIAAIAPYTGRAGLRGYRALGRLALERFETALGRLVAAGDDPERFPAAAEFLRPWAGGFVEDGLVAGLLEGEPEGPVRVPAGREAAVRALYLGRWCGFIAPRHPLEEVLHAEDRAVLLRWKVAGSQMSSVEDRLEAVKRLAALDRRFDAHLATGLLYIQAGRLELARLELQTARERGGSPDVERALKWVGWAIQDKERKKAAGKKRAGGGGG